MFLAKALEREDTVVWSEAVENEVVVSPQIAKVRAVLRAFTRLGRVQVVPASQEQIDEARGLCEERSVPFGDTIHAVLAKDTGALLVTRDAHFQELRNVVPSRLPEEILWP